MDLLSPQSTGGDRILQVPIDTKLSNNWGSGGTGTVFEPGGEIDQPGNRGSSNIDPGSLSGPKVNAPEKKLTLFALQLAVLEKIATGLGTLGFVWATVVLLGGFAIILLETDFWFITIILLIEGARIFSRSHELEWQHQSTWTITDAGISSFKKLKSSSSFIVRVVKGIHGSSSESHSLELRERTNGARPSRNRLTSTSGPELKEKNNEERSSIRSTRTWESSEVPLLPYIGWLFLSKNISKLFYWWQLLSAITCITLSVLRLIEMSRHGTRNQMYEDSHNMRPALIVFYGLALAEALFCLLEKLYWEWTMDFRQLLKKVNDECELGDLGINSLKRFFYDAYSECVNNSIFDGLKMDLVSFASELLVSDSSDERLIGAHILHKFSTTPRLADETLEKIGTSVEVIERLVEMLSWKNPKEAEMRRKAAEIVSKLAGKKHNSLRVAGIPGAMESISSLLYTQRSDGASDGASDEIGEKNIIHDHENHEFFAFNQLGLTILKKLASDYDNCEKIGNTKGLLPKIIEFTYAEGTLLRDSHEEDNRILAVRRSLQVLKLLAGTSGTVGNHLRQEIVEIVFTVSNIRQVLKHGEKYPELQQLGIEILTSLAFDVEATEKIGSTGGIIKELFRIFFQKPNTEDQHHVRVVAGEAIAMLALDSDKNCSRILKQQELTKLVWALEVPGLRVNSARILRHLCRFAPEDCYGKLQGIYAAAPTVLKAIMSEKDNAIMSEKDKLQEVMLGLATQVFRFMTLEEESIVFNQIGIDEDKLATKLVQILRFYAFPSAKVPRMRRFAIDLAILMMNKNNEMVRTFRAAGMVEELGILAETTSDIESFNIFSGTIGLSRHGTGIHALVEKALELLAH